MKKKTKKLVLAKETVKNLDGVTLENVQGGYFTTYSFTVQCSTIKPNYESQ
jgi:hypothetical protein